MYRFLNVNRTSIKWFKNNRARGFRFYIRLEHTPSASLSLYFVILQTQGPTIANEAFGGNLSQHCRFEQLFKTLTETFRFLAFYFKTLISAFLGDFFFFFKPNWQERC